MPTRILTADRYKGVLGKNSPFDPGIVAIDVYFRNDNDKPIRLNFDTIRLISFAARRGTPAAGALAAEEVADRMLLKADANPQ